MVAVQFVGVRLLCMPCCEPFTPTLTHGVPLDAASFERHDHTISPESSNTTANRLQ